jgi:CYTH domain-containing protein
MATEIEHKYLVKKELWDSVVPLKSEVIRQAYLLTDPEKTIRVRTKGAQAFFTIKSINVGATRQEFEYEIPMADALELMGKFCSHLVEKTRHLVMFGDKTWEVDEFDGLNAGLIVAEIELTSEDEDYTLPTWVDENVTHDMKYANSNLALKPFSTWSYFEGNQ